MRTSRIRPGVFSCALPLLVALAWSSACWALDLAPLRPETPPRFSADASVGVDAEGQASVSVAISIPYDELQWIKAPGGFTCGVELTVVFEARGDQRGFGDLWSQRVSTPRFAVTTASNLAMSESRTFSAAPGRYELRVRVRDVNSLEESVARADLEVPDYSRVTLGFADLELGVLDDAQRFVPVTGRRFGREIERLAARAALFDRRPGPWPRDYRFLLRVLDEQGAEVLRAPREVRLDAPAQPFVVQPDSSRLFLGSYRFELTFGEGREAVRAERSFDVEESAPPGPLELERLLEPLSFIADIQEVEAIRDLDPSERPAAWEAFWQRRDPTPETARNEAMIEFFRRIRFVDRTYRDYGPGWRTDRGRIYIKFGAPDQVETRPPTLESPELEIWYYNRLSRRFVFADYEGFGRYRLVGPALE